MNNFLGLLAAVLIIAGCAPTRDNAIAAQHADQSVQAVALVLSGDEVASAAQGMTEEQKAAYETSMRKAFALLRAASVSLQPVIGRLSVGLDPAEIAPGTTVEDAIAHTDAFVAFTNQQAGKAAAETDEAIKQNETISKWRQIAIGIGDSWLAKLGLGGGTLALVAGFGVKAAGVYRANRVALLQTIKGLDQARKSMGDGLWDAHVATNLEVAQDEPVRAMVSQIQTKMKA
jgi:uncharacterized protein YfiM (DUF2279 family)